jgi:hypothetical protein
MTQVRAALPKHWHCSVPSLSCSSQCCAALLVLSCGS